ncbi:hypothetical protein F4553_007350 [Allocatelliglobosispora scoriae]|uniref:Uncharacterized protein n=1 Tax=Allocatelliglobosispora scoriae TaxID=643052 RepID=A0A841C208_9ACTN|nr:hypothetical protein [Allocatelliglobosispora scoriae]MBB5873916.1 hypothetical protein [Allocatelliglobosispora scoriae]
MKRRLALAVTMVAGLGVLIPAPASAAVNPVYVSGTASANDSVAEKSSTATCPNNTRVIGGGGSITGGGAQVHLTRLQPLGNTDQFTVTAAEHGTFTPNWRVQAYAICSAGLTGVEYIGFSVASSSSASKSATAICGGTGERKLISTGARIVNGGGEVFLDDMIASSEMYTTTATAYEDQDGYAGNWSFYSYGVCADTPAGLEFKSATAVTDSTGDTVTATCTGTKKLLGLGGLMSSPDGQAHYTGLTPSSTLTSATAVTSEDVDGYAGDWFTRVYAICAS